jgi:hypothetical protein
MAPWSKLLRTISSMIATMMEGSLDIDSGDTVMRNPVLELHKGWHGPKKARKELDLPMFEKKMEAWVIHCTTLPSCIDVYNQSPSKCSCCYLLSFTEEELASVGKYLVEYACLKPYEKKARVAEWIRYAQAHAPSVYEGGRGAYSTKNFLFPGTNETFVCKNAVAYLLGYKRTSWSKVSQHVSKGKALEHGLHGKNSNRINTYAHSIMGKFFGLLERLGTPRATRIVKKTMGNGDGTGTGSFSFELRDDNEELVELPSYMTKFGCYNRFLRENGWEFEYNCKNRVTSKDPIKEDHPHPGQIPSWPTFLEFWKENYDYVRILKPAKDVCGECYVYANRIKHSQAGGKRKHPLISEDSDEDDFICLPALPDSKNNDPQDRMIASEKLIERASEHVKRAQAQRELFQEKKKLAEETAKLPTEERVFCFVIDYSQNMYLPNFEGEQPGETYYYSPLNAYVLGIVDTALAKLSAHTYMEYDGKKGGNNVASLIWKELTRKNLKPGSMAKEIVFVFDNCTGQNKNNNVLRQLFLLAKLNFAKDIRCIFLERGHTKNDCDRMFNLMKIQYRKSNVYTPEQLYRHIDTNKNVDCVPIADSDFLDWGKYQDRYLTKLPKVLIYHVFHVSSADADTMNCQIGRDDPVESFQGVKKKYRGVDWASSWQEEVSPLAPVGIQDIKWIELYDKWGPLVPQKYRQTFKYYNNDPGLERRGKVKADRKVSKKVRSERSKTEEDTIIAEAETGLEKPDKNPEKIQ